MIEILVKRVICGMVVHVTESVIKYVKLVNIWILKIVLRKNI